MLEGVGDLQFLKIVQQLDLSAIVTNPSPDHSKQGFMKLLRNLLFAFDEVGQLADVEPANIKRGRLFNHRCRLVLEEVGLHVFQVEHVSSEEIGSLGPIFQLFPPTVAKHHLGFVDSILPVGLTRVHDGE